MYSLRPWIAQNKHTVHAAAHIRMAVPEHAVDQEASLPADDVGAQHGQLAHHPPHRGGAVLPPCRDQSTWISRHVSSTNVLSVRTY